MEGNKKVVVIGADGDIKEFPSIEEMKQTLTPEQLENLEVVHIPEQPKEPTPDMIENAMPYLMMPGYPFLPPYMSDGQSARRKRREQNRKPKKKNMPIWK